jgi:hypothetical protein
MSTQGLFSMNQVKKIMNANFVSFSPFDLVMTKRTRSDGQSGKADDSIVFLVVKIGLFVFVSDLQYSFVNFQLDKKFKMVFYFLEYRHLYFAVCT